MRKLSKLVGRLGEFISHPSFAELLDWHEGEQRERRLAQVTAHVLACPRCAAEAGSIGRTLDSCRLVLGTAPVEAGSDAGEMRLLGALRERAEPATAPEQPAQEDESRNDVWPTECPPATRTVS